MRNIHKTFATSVVVVGLALAGAGQAMAQTTPDPHHPDQTPPASARPATPGMPGAGMMGPDMMRDMMGGMMGRGTMPMMGNCPMMGMGSALHADGRIAFLKVELGITDAQKAVWDAYADALKKNLQGMATMQQSMMKVMQAKSPVERLDAQLAAMEGRVATLKAMKPAVTALYGALTAEQRQKADELLTAMGCMM